MTALLKGRKQKKEIKTFIKHIKHILVRDDDILDELKKEKLHNLSGQLNDILKKSGRQLDDREIKSEVQKLKEKFNFIIPPKSLKIIREYAEIFIVALTVAFGVRALFIQPFKIPTSSMQPTLYGIHYAQKDVVPDIIQPINWALYSTFKAELTTERGGDLEGFYPSYSKFFYPYSAFNIGGIKYSLPGAKGNVYSYCFQNGANVEFSPGEKVCDGWLSQGDHLFVDRFSYHFVPPGRGDIVIFTTENIYNDSNGEPLTDHGFYYVKRLVGMPGDRLRIKDGMLYVKAVGSDKYVPITAFNIPAFDRIFSKKGGYQGYFPVGRLAEGKEVDVPQDSYFMLGDNSLVSADGRYWGFVPRANIVGKAFFVFWPLSRRWGIADRQPPINVPTVIEKSGTIPAMSLQ